LRALVIRDDKNKFRDLEDVVKVARALGQQVFKTREHVRVLRIGMIQKLVMWWLWKVHKAVQDPWM